MKIPFNVITFHFINLLIVGIGQNKVTYFSGQIQRVKDNIITEVSDISFWLSQLFTTNCKSKSHDKLSGPKSSFWLLPSIFQENQPL
jgi:hypothetical protein